MASSHHSICRWTFHAGKGGFHPGSIRPDWTAEKLPTSAIPKLVDRKIRPRLPKGVALGFELHYDTEINEAMAQDVVAGMADANLHLAMITPGAHSHFAYGGIASLDPQERAAAASLGQKTIDLAYGAMRSAWHPDEAMHPTLVLWNGSYGYDMGTVGVREMHFLLVKSIAEICQYEASAGGKLSIGIEPKPNEGHAAMLLPTVASVIALWHQVHRHHGIKLDRKGVNMEIGHSEMIGLDPINDVVEQLAANMMVHFHLNSQGLSDGILLGGPGKFDIDFGFRVSAANVCMTRIIQDSGYSRWLGHDMQARPYDNEDQAIERVVRSILSYEACAIVAAKMDTAAMVAALAKRDALAVELMMGDLASDAQKAFREMV